MQSFAVISGYIGLIVFLFFNIFRKRLLIFNHLLALSVPLILLSLAGMLDLFGGIFCLLFITSCFFVGEQLKKLWPIAVLLGCIAVMMILHKIPLFHNFLAYKDLQLSSDALSFNLYLNVDKPLAIFGLYLLIQSVLRLNFAKAAGSILPMTQRFRILLPTFLLVMVSLFSVLATFSGFSKFTPKMPEAFWLWAGNNFFLVCFGEELLFRGILLNLHHSRWAFVLSSVAFGLLHFRGGGVYVILSTIAGLFYGLIFLQVEGSWRKKLLSSMSLHFAFNVVHFLFFTYPALKPGPTV